MFPYTRTKDPPTRHVCVEPNRKVAQTQAIEFKCSRQKQKKRFSPKALEWDFDRSRFIGSEQRKKTKYCREEKETIDFITLFICFSNRNCNIEYCSQKKNTVFRSDLVRRFSATHYVHSWHEFCRKLISPLFCFRFFFLFSWVQKQKRSRTLIGKRRTVAKYAH